MTEVWQKRVLWIAAAWNVLGGVSALVDPAKHFEQLYTSSLNLSEPLELFFYRCVWINILGWGVACFALYSRGLGTGALVAAGVFDLLIAALFALALFPRRRRVPAPVS
jgi:hypothetical protein